MATLYLITGSCPQTEAEARLEWAELTGQLPEYEAIVARMREEWADPEKCRVKEALGFKVVGPNPDALVAPLATPEHPMFWHEPRRDDTLVCPCGHMADYLCDEPIGKGRTCDKPACRCCRNHVGPDLDQCSFHATTQPREARP